MTSSSFSQAASFFGSSLSSAASASLKSIRHGVYVARAGSQDLYSYFRHGTVLAASDLTTTALSASPAPKIIILVPDHHDRRASLRGLVKVARATIANTDAAQDAIVIAADNQGVEPLLALAPNVDQILDIQGQQERDFVFIAAATLGLKSLVHRILGSAPGAEIALISQGVGAIAASNLACGSAPAQFAQPAHAEYQPMFSRGEYINNILADVRFSDRSYDHTAPWAAGPATSSGLSARLSLRQCAENSDRTLDFCLADDAFCASGHTVDVTSKYFSNDTMVQRAAEYVHDRMFGARVAVRDGGKPVPVSFLGPQAMDNIDFGASDGMGNVIGHRAKRAAKRGKEGAKAKGGEGAAWVPGKQDDPALIKGTVPSMPMPTGSMPPLEAEATAPYYASTHWVNSHVAAETYMANSTKSGVYATGVAHASGMAYASGAKPTVSVSNSTGNWTLPISGTAAASAPAVETYMANATTSNFYATGVAAASDAMPMVSTSAGNWTLPIAGTAAVLTSAVEMETTSATEAETYMANATAPGFYTTGMAQASDATPTISVSSSAGNWTLPISSTTEASTSAVETSMSTTAAEAEYTEWLSKSATESVYSSSASAVSLIVNGTNMITSATWIGSVTPTASVTGAAGLLG